MKTLQELEDELAEAKNDLRHAWDSRQIELCQIAIEEIEEEINYLTETSSQSETLASKQQDQKQFDQSSPVGS